MIRKKDQGYERKIKEQLRYDEEGGRRVRSKKRGKEWMVGVKMKKEEE